MVMEFLPPPGVHSWATLIFKDPSGFYALFDFLYGFEEFMKK
jgi:hypothetical protein